MGINQRLLVCITVVVIVLAVTGILLISAWMYPLTIAIMACEDLSITDVEFEESYLTLTVRNLCKYPTTISEVMVNQTSTPHTVPINEQLSAYGQVSIRISFKWASDYTYQVRVKTARGNHFYNTTVAP
jgi:hypothetical protein